MRKLLLTTCCLVACLMGNGQSVIDNRALQLQQKNTQHLQEKIHAHLNRTDLIVGEILWFKLYTVDASLHLPTDLSKVGYVEIIDKNNQPVLQAKVALKNGLGNGSLYLPSTMPSGSYLFRAYTNWMKNLDAAFFFQQQITIVNTLKASDVASGLGYNNLTLELFPEGGNWVEGLPSQTAFKLTDSNGIGAQGKVCILNQKLDTVAQATTLLNGIGRLLFTPIAGENYEAVALGRRLGMAQKSISPIAPSGYTLVVSDSASSIKVKVMSSRPHAPLSMLVHMRQSVKVIQTSVANGGATTFTFGKDKLGDGISHITIFDGENRPVCERLFFKKPSTVYLTVEPNQSAYNIRRKVSISVSTKESQGDYSVSVYRADSLNTGASILSNLLLTSDLKGTVETPEFYFSEDVKAELAADNLMLTHGWRRFDWNKIADPGSIKPEYLPEVRGHLIQGKIVDGSGNPAVQTAGFLSNPGRKIRLYAARSDANGKIRFQMKDFMGEGKIIAQADYLTDSLLRITIESPFSDKFIPWGSTTLKLPQSAERPLLARSIGMQVQDIFSEDETYFTYTPVAVDSVPFYGTPDERYKLDDYTRFSSMEDVLREYVRGVWVSKNRNNFKFRIPDKFNGGLFKENPLVLIDGVPVFDINQVMEIDPLKIKSIDIVARKYFIGPVDLSGIVSFSSYTGDMAGAAIDPRSVLLNYEGLQQVRQFYSPQYNSASSRASRLPDQRHQLYWNPSVQLEKNKTTTLEFYTSDIEGKFLIIMEGITRKGAPAAVVQTFSVSQ